MALADLKLQAGSLQLRAIANALNLQNPTEACGNADNHIVQQRTGQPMQRLVVTQVGGAGNIHFAILLGNCHIPAEFLAQFALRSFDPDKIIFPNLYRNSLRHRNGHTSDA